jgi:hypothetical protein
MIATGVYKHYKGKNYQVLGEAIHSETLEIMVVYKPLYETNGIPNDNLWVRPLTMFLEQVNVEGKLMSRFEKI